MSESRAILDTFENHFPEREYRIEIVQPGFASLCPKSGKPDFGTITITYTPKAKCLEINSLEEYLQTFRTQSIFYEHATNTILDDLVATCIPQWMKVEAALTAHGGITQTVTAQYTAVM